MIFQDSLKIFSRMNHLIFWVGHWVVCFGSRKPWANLRFIKPFTRLRDKTFNSFFVPIQFFHWISRISASRESLQGERRSRRRMAENAGVVNQLVRVCRAPAPLKISAILPGLWLAIIFTRLDHHDWKFRCRFHLRRTRTDTGESLSLRPASDLNWRSRTCIADDSKWSLAGGPDPNLLLLRVVRKVMCPKLVLLRSFKVSIK